jgi:outer membrane protein, heavy metal efflux system
VTHHHVLAAATFAALCLTTDLGLSAGGGPARPPRALSLPDALTWARTHNPDLRAAAQDVEITRGRLVKAHYPSQFNPAVSGELAHRERNDPGAGGSSKDFSVALSQEVEVAGQRAPRVREAEEGVARAEAEVRDRERLLDAAVKRAFFQALVAARRLELQRAIEDLSCRVRDGATARAKAGEVPPMEANLAEIRYGQARKDTLTAEAEEGVALIGLRRLLNLAPESAVAPAGRLRGEAPAVPLGPALEHAFATRPDLAAATHEVARAGAERTLTRRLAFPNPTLEVFYREEDTGPDRIAGGGITIPLPVFDRRQGELVALAGRENQARLQVAALRRAIEQEVSEALRRYDAGRRTLAVFEQDVLARVDENYRFIETAYRAGKIDLFQLIVVQNDLVQAQLSYLDSVARVRDAQIDLERAVGSGLEEVMP